MSTIKSKEDGSYVVQNGDLMPMLSDASGLGKSIKPSQLFALNSSFGALMTNAGGTVQTPGDTPVLLTAFNINGESSSDVTPNPTNDVLEVANAGSYAVTAQFSLTGTVGSTVTFEIYKDIGGTPTNTGIKCVRKLGSSDLGSCSLTGIVAVSASSDIGIYVSTDGASDDVTIVESQLVIRRVS